MEIGHCPYCDAPYTASEVAGFGILRPRTQRDGGPTLDYGCQSCGRTVRLVPHGEGRYARPGEPPPPSVPAGARQPPWLRGRRPPAGREAPARAPEPAPEQVRPPARQAEEPVAGHEIPAPAPEEGPLGPAEALALLGVAPSAERAEIERAFRERSLACHPDKVAHLDDDFQALAERKFRRLLAAKHLLLG